MFSDNLIERQQALAQLFDVGLWAYPVAVIALGIAYWKLKEWI